MPAVLRIVGPPGSGKTLLIVSLVEALRQRGHRVATAVRREALEPPDLDAEAARALDAGAIATVLVLASGARVTLERAVELSALGDIVASLDPQVDLLLAEGFEDPGYPAIELSPAPSEGTTTDESDLLAVVASDEIAGAFAKFGPGETNGVADLVEQKLLGDAPEVSMELTVDGRTVKQGGFVTDLIARPILTMIEQLKGVGVPRAVRLSIRRRGRDRD